MVPVRVTSGWALLVAACGSLLAAVTLATAHPYFNSSEPGCDGSDPNVLMCDDFEKNQNGDTPGNWYAENCDVANNNGGIGNRSKGWCGNISDPISPPGAARCGGLGAAGTDCTATGGPQTGQIGGQNMADHSFVNEQQVSEIYVRHYYKPLRDYRWGWEKMLTFNGCCAGVGGIKFGNLHLAGAQSGTRFTSVELTMQLVPNTCGEDAHRKQNQGPPMLFTGDNWYFIEIHIRLSTPPCQPDGLLEVWIDNCGPNGLGCAGTPTLRMRHANVRFDRQTANDLIGSVWFENWGNLGSIGEAYKDQIKVSKVGPIGFMSGITDHVPPSPPGPPTLK